MRVDLMTIGAIGFAGFALYYVTKKPSGQVAAQPAQLQRDAGLIQWFNVQNNQAIELSGVDWLNKPDISLKDFFPK